MDLAGNNFYPDYLWKGNSPWIYWNSGGRIKGKIMVVLITCGRICKFRLQMQPRMVKKFLKNGTIYHTIHQPVELTAHHMLKLRHIRVFTNLFEKKTRE